MGATILSTKITTIHWEDVIEYPATGVKSKILLEHGTCRYTLMTLVANMHIADHTSPRNATVNVIEGRGVLTLDGEDIVLQPGVFIFLPANAHHALEAVTNLAFLLTFSE